MDKVIQILDSAKEPLAVVGLVLIGLVHHADNTVVVGVVGALAGIIVGKSSKTTGQ